MPGGACYAPRFYKTGGFVLIHVSFFPPLPSRSYELRVHVCVTKLPPDPGEGGCLGRSDGCSSISAAGFAQQSLVFTDWPFSKPTLIPYLPFTCGPRKHRYLGSLDTNQLFLRLQTNVWSTSVLFFFQPWGLDPSPLISLLYSEHLIKLSAHNRETSQIHIKHSATIHVKLH